MKEGGLSYDVEVLTVHRQGDEIILSKIGSPTRSRSMMVSHSFYDMSHLILSCSVQNHWFSQMQKLVCLFVCLLFERDCHQVQVDLLAGEAWPQPLQCEAI